MVTKTISIFLISVCISCGYKSSDKNPGTNQLPDKSVALKFINDYTDFCKTNESELNSVQWIQRNQLTTAEFKSKYRQIIESARQRDEELGLGFDPILDAQDFPENGFEFSTYDKDGYVIVKGKDNTEFITTIKMKLVDNKWMIDGAGIINVPKDKQVRQ